MSNTPAKIVPAEPPAVERPPTPARQARLDLWNLARQMSESDLIPAALRGKPANVFLVLGHGAALGLDEFEAIQSIYVVDGKPTCSASLMRALIYGRGHVLQWQEVRNDRVTLYGRRRDTGADATVTWTLDDARTAKLVGKGNWGTYPRSMLAARATSEIARLVFADVLHGIVYTPEELGAVGPLAAIDVDSAPVTDDDLYDADSRFAPPDDVDPETGELDP